MKMSFKTGLLAAWLLPATVIVQGGQALAQDQDIVDPCAEQEGVLATAYHHALELLMTDTSLPEAELSISVKGRKGKWFYEFPSENALAETGVDEACNHSGPLVLPRSTTIELQVTSDDDIYDWTVPGSEPVLRVFVRPEMQCLSRHPARTLMLSV